MLCTRQSNSTTQSRYCVDVVTSALFSLCKKNTATYVFRASKFLPTKIFKAFQDCLDFQLSESCLLHVIIFENNEIHEKEQSLVLLVTTVMLSNTEDFYLPEENPYTNCNRLKSYYKISLKV